MSQKKSYWQEDFGDEWVNFTEGVPIDIVIENAEPEEVETTWGTATIIKVREYRESELKGGNSPSVLSTHQLNVGMVTDKNHWEPRSSSSFESTQRDSEEALLMHLLVDYLQVATDILSSVGVKDGQPPTTSPG